MDASEIKTFVITLAVVLLWSCANSQSLPNERAIPVFPNYNPPFYSMRETGPIGHRLGNMTIERGPGLNIKPAGDEVNVTVTSNTADKLTVDVFLNKQFDYDSNISSITLNFFGSNVYYSNIIHSVTLINHDENDEIPTFQNLPYSVSVPETVAKGTPVYNSIQAIDRDKNDQLQYSLQVNAQGADEEYKNMFILDKYTAVLTLNGSLDFESKRFYQYKVTVLDQASPPHSSVADVFITVSDVQDTPPFFSGEPFIKTTVEETPVTTSIFTVKAEDGDKSIPNSISYSLLKDTCLGLFGIDSHKGDISVKSRVDRDSGAVWNNSGICVLTILATEGNEHPQEPNSISTATTTVTITVDDKNDNLPECSDKYQYINNYAPMCTQTMYSQTVKENLTIESLILQVVANDADGTAPNNLFIYSIDQKNSEKFIIDSTSGKITLRSNLDRETADHYNITVTVTDLGTPSRSSSCSVYLTVLDINDTPPTFSKASQILHFSENIFGLEILNEAQDKDQDKNLSYQIDWTQSTAKNPSGQQANMSHLQNCLKINNTDGKITSTQPLDREMVQEFTLKITVSDEKSDTGIQQDVASVTVYVDDVNDNKPTFSSSQQYQTKVQENMPVGTEIQFTGSTLVVEDLDQGNNSIFVVSLMNYSEYFAVEPTEGNGRQIFSIVVTNSSILDFEVTETLQIVLKAVETKTTEKFTSTATVIVNIKNNNDNMPDFVDAPFTVYVNEESPPGTSVYQVKAVDNDKGEFGIVYYSLPEQPKEFVINRTTGVVTLSAILSREQQASYTLKVRVEDVGHFGSTTQLTVNLLDINNHSPNFTQQNYQTTIPENQKFFMPPLVIQAFDGDEPGNKNSEIRYSISSISKNLEQYFTIDPTSGEIVLNKGLDYESMDKSLHGVIEFYVNATDQSPPYHSVSATVQVIVLDVNDEVPSFSQSSYDINIPENMTPETNIVAVKASDADGTEPNNQIYYVIQSGGQEKFQVNGSSGEISVNIGAVFDRDVMSSYSLTVLAIDKGNPPNTATATVSINVTDVNNKAPVISSSSLQTSIFENSTKGSEVTSITATDPDLNPKLKYSLLWNDSHAFEKDKELAIKNVEEWFVIDSQSGKITVNSTLDREKVQLITLNVLVEDLNAETSTPQFATATVIIIVLDVNDNPPQLCVSNQVAIVSEATQTGTEKSTLSYLDFNITATSTPPVQEHHDIRCHLTFMDIYIPVSVAPDAKLSLLDASCELVNNGTHYIGHVMYNTCGTMVSSFSDHLQVHNQITVHTNLDVSAPVVFDEVKIVLDCRVQLEQQLNGAFQSVTVAPIHEVDDNEANFLLKEFSGPDYRQEITRYPVQVPATGELFLEVSLASPQDDTGVRIVQCWATPTSSADDSTRFSLIRDGCPASRAVHPQPSPGVGQVRFSVQAFHFPGSISHDVTAYLHCDVSTCRGNTCNVNCDVTTRKRRRSLQSHSTLTYGPVFVK